MTGNRAALFEAMPALFAHEGVWEGNYQHVDEQGALIDAHEARVICEMPDGGPFHYLQRNRFTWAGGRVVTAELPGVLRDGRLWWDLPTFAGSAWTTHDGLILLNLERRDDPGARFFEIIVLGEGGRYRARSWHWFKDGRLFKRTLCDERKVG